jgi:alanyl-tRNA synthetase
MLGNFSFGDYFKHDAIEMAWTLLTKEWGLDPSRLYATVFKGEPGIPRDDEAYARWREFLPADHVGELGMADNFWAMGDTGPCGRCSEIYYDRGADVPGTGRFIPDVEAGSERFVEIWNNVFMEFERDPSGTLHALPAPSIDTGMGLERISAVMQGTLSNYDTPLFTPILAATARLAGRAYGRSMEPGDVSMRVVADHLRAMTFLIADGVVPSNEWRGYVLRKIMRRAMRHGRKLGLHEPFLHTLVDVLVGEMGGAYPELRASRDAIVQVVKAEEERFDAVLTSGLPRLEDALDRAAAGAKVLPGDEAFKLYDTYGLPRDFIEDLALNQGLRFDAEGFEREMEAQREKARAGSDFKGGGLPGLLTKGIAKEVFGLTGKEFSGYERDVEPAAEVLMLWDDEGLWAVKNGIAEGKSGWAILSKTPFYVDAGGQVSDHGALSWDSGGAEVVDVIREPGLPRVHKVVVRRGTLRVQQTVLAAIDKERRDATRRNHTATHLLHAALRQVLGPHVKQAGSLVAPDRLRFDFVHFSAVTADELRRVEWIVNEAILKNEAVTTTIRDTREAIAAGAMALFGEKYGDRVRVVAIGDGTFSTELCGGTHVRATGDIGVCLLIEESGVAASVRRIEARTGLAALSYARPRLEQFERVRAVLNVAPADVESSLHARLQSLDRALKERERVLAKAAVQGSEHAKRSSHKFGDTEFVTVWLPGHIGSKEAFRNVVDTERLKLPKGGVLVVATTPEQRVMLAASVTGNVTDRLKAGQLVKALAPIVGGGGGGRPDFAEAGGKDPAQIDAMLAAAPDVVRRLLGA